MFSLQIEVPCAKGEPCRFDEIHLLPGANGWIPQMEMNRSRWDNPRSVNRGKHVPPTKRHRILLLLFFLKEIEAITDQWLNGDECFVEEKKKKEKKSTSFFLMRTEGTLYNMEMRGRV